MRIIDIINENFNEIPKGMAENPYQRRIIEKNMDEVIAFVKTGQLDPTGDLFYEMYEYYANEIPVHIRQNPRKLERTISAKIAPMLKFYGERAIAGYHSTKKHEPLNPNRPAKTTVHETATAGATSAGSEEALAQYRTLQLPTMVGSSKGQEAREQGIQPGAQEWFKHWFGK